MLCQYKKVVEHEAGPATESNPLRACEGVSITCCTNCSHVASSGTGTAIFLQLTVRVSGCPGYRDQQGIDHPLEYSYHTSLVWRPSQR